MEITCPGCKARYRVPDDKLPEKGVAYIKCPKCQERMEVRAPEETSLHSLGGIHVTSSGYSDAEGYELFEPGVKTALIYCTETDAEKQLMETLSMLDYQVRGVVSARELSARYKYHVYDLVVLYQSGPDPDEHLRQILDVINAMDMETRRKVFVLYIHLSGNPFDSLQSFYLSVDLTITPLDIGRLSQVLPNALKAKEARYKAFTEARQRLQEQAL